MSIQFIKTTLVFRLLVVLIIILNSYSAFAQGACDCSDGDLIPVENGNFEQGGSGTLYNSICPSSWNCGAFTPDTGNPSSGINCHSNLLSPSCDAGQFVLLYSDGGSWNEEIAQEISCLIIGEVYNISFSQGLIHEYTKSSGQLNVSFGSQTMTSPLMDITGVPYIGFSGWQQVTLGPFTATASVMELKFVVNNAKDGVCPSGNPNFCNDVANGDIEFCPFLFSVPQHTSVLLDGVSICGPKGCCDGQCDDTVEIDCDDEDPCTINDKAMVASCDNESICEPCQGEAINPCSDIIEMPCDDGDPCTGNDVEKVAACDNYIICTPCAGKALPSCSETIEIPCDDDNPCTENDVEKVDACDNDIICIPCIGQRDSCLYTIKLPCDDGNSCTENDMITVEECDSITVCIPCIGDTINCANGATSIIPCNDGDSTTVDDVQTILLCDSSICVPCLGVAGGCNTGTTTIRICDDGDPCTTNDMETVLDSVGTICIPCAGMPLPCGADQQCELSRICDDGDPCTVNDMETILLSDSSICIPCLGIIEYANVKIDSVVCSDDKATYKVFFSTGFSTKSNSESLPFNNLGSDNYSIIEIDSSRAITITLQGMNAGCDTSFQVESPNCGCLAQADAGNKQTIDCINTFVDLSGTGTSLGNGFTYSWTNSLGIEVGTSASFTTDIAGTYTLKVTDNTNNCESISMVEVKDIRNVPTAIITADPSSVIDCAVTVVALTAQAQNNVEYTWSYSGQSENALRIELSQSTMVYLMAMDTVTGCTGIDSLFVDKALSYPLIEFEGVSELTCRVLETLIVLDASSTLGPNIIHQWYDSNNNLLIGEEGESLLINTPGTYYIVSIDTTNECTGRDSIVIIENVDFPSSEAGNDLFIPCDESSIALSGSTDDTSFSIQWTTIQGQILGGANTLNPSVSMTGWYFLEVYNPENECLSIDSIYVNPTQDAIETIEYDSQSPICFGDTNGWIYQATINGGTPPITYTINGTSNSDGLFSDLAPGNYLIEAIDAKGCTYDTSIVLSAPGIISLDLVRNQFELNTDNPNASLELITTATTIDTIIYQPNVPVSCNNCLNPELTFTESGEYTITLIDENGCVATTTFTVTIDPTVHIFVPNSFSPNEDGVNDLFFMHSKEVFQISEFKIFDRWGGVLYQAADFKSNDTKYAWDGDARGKRVDTGVYVYYIKYLDLAGNEHILAGDLAVIY